MRTTNKSPRVAAMLTEVHGAAHVFSPQNKEANPKTKRKAKKQVPKCRFFCFFTTSQATIPKYSRFKCAKTTTEIPQREKSTSKDEIGAKKHARTRHTQKQTRKRTNDTEKPPTRHRQHRQDTDKAHTKQIGAEIDSQERDT